MNIDAEAAPARAASPVACAVVGLKGKMATYVAAAMAAQPERYDCQQLCARDLRGLEEWLTAVPKADGGPAPVVLDFTHPGCTSRLLDLLDDMPGVALVSGTSGLDAALEARLEQLAESPLYSGQATSPWARHCRTTWPVCWGSCWARGPRQPFLTSTMPASWTR